MKNDGSKIISGVMYITPDQASKWLANNHTGRRKIPSESERIARAILEGKWVVSGETIIVDSDGRLLDGQHRLEAIVLAGIAVPSVVALNVDPRVAGTIGLH